MALPIRLLQQNSFAKQHEQEKCTPYRAGDADQKVESSPSLHRVPTELPVQLSFFSDQFTFIQCLLVTKSLGTAQCPAPILKATLRIYPGKTEGLMTLVTYHEVTRNSEPC